MRSTHADTSATRRRVLVGWGADLSGPGWRRVVNGTGDYTIYFDKPFAGLPNVTVSPVHASAALVAKVTEVDKFHFRISEFTSNGIVATDSGFLFRVEGVEQTA